MADDQTSNTDGQAAGQESGQQQGELKGNTLMTQPDGKAGDKGGESQAAGQESAKVQGQGQGGDNKKDDTADAVPDKPDGYKFAFAKETQVDTELLGNFQKTAHELGISQDKAQKLASFYETHAAKAWERVAEAQRQALESAKAKWEEGIQKSPDFVRERADIQAALRQYGDPELYELLDQTNLGAHPKMWAFMAKVGRALAEPGFHGKNSGKDKNAADVLYPNQGQ
jgi:hypothetical protein